MILHSTGRINLEMRETDSSQTRRVGDWKYIALYANIFLSMPQVFSLLTLPLEHPCNKISGWASWNACRNQIRLDKRQPSFHIDTVLAPTLFASRAFFSVRVGRLLLGCVAIGYNWSRRSVHGLLVLSRRRRNVSILAMMRGARAGWSDDSYTFATAIAILSFEQYHAHLLSMRYSVPSNFLSVWGEEECGCDTSKVCIVAELT